MELTRNEAPQGRTAKMGAIARSAPISHMRATLGALGGPTTAYIYDWNVLPLGQLLWLKELMTFKEFPPLQTPESYNLSNILQQMEKNKGDD